MVDSGLSSAEAFLARTFNKHLRSVILSPELTPGVITAVYLVFGFAALYFSDVILPMEIRDQTMLAQIQALKGGLEIMVTAGLIFGLTTHSQRIIKDRNERLNDYFTERNVLHRVFRHNLRQDINIIMGYSDRIKARTGDQDLHEDCRRILDKIDTIQRYQDKIIKIEGILDPPIEVDRIDLAERVRTHDLIRELQAADGHSIELDVPNEATVIASPHIFDAFGELLENAVEHTVEEELEVKVVIDESSDGLISLAVMDNGPGIPAFERRAIGRMEGEDLAHASGLGLWLVKLACTVSGGRFDIPPDQSEGGVAIMRLPEAYDHTFKRSVQSIAGIIGD